MVKDNVLLNVSYEGKREDLATGLDQAVAAALQQRTGLKLADVLQARSTLGSPYQINDKFVTYLPVCGWNERTF
jgi:hypothetical protein